MDDKPSFEIYGKLLVVPPHSEKETFDWPSKKEPASGKSIRINKIELGRSEYSKRSRMESKELITTPVRSIAVFASEYIPEHFPPGKYIHYILTVNGIDYEIEPINSHRAGKKIIKHSVLKRNESYTEYINEPIKSAKLTIVIQCPDLYSSPAVSDIKILYGEKAQV